MKKFKTLAVAIVSILCFSLLLIQCEDTLKIKNEVSFIRLRYEGKPITGDKLNAFLTQETISFTANVQTSGKSAAGFTLASSNEDIATVSGTTVNLVGDGTTTITATATANSNQKHAITLTIVDNSPIQGLESPYNISNNFGEDASTEFLAVWHNDTDVEIQKLQIVLETEDFLSGGLREIAVDGIEFYSENETNTVAVPPTGDYPARNVFRAHVENLTPDTKYKYRMGNWGAWSDTFYHQTAGGRNTTDFSFTVVTDPQDDVSTGHTDMGTTLVAANAYDSDNRFFMMNGDLVEQIGFYPQEIANYTKEANRVNTRTPIAATQGNHDTYYATAVIGNPMAVNNEYVFNEGRVFNAFTIFPGNGHQFETDTELTKSHSYYFYYNNVLVIMLNSMVASNASGHAAQVAWLRTVLQNDKDNNLSDYIVIGTHVGLFSSRSVDRYYSAPMREAYCKLVTDFDVDIFFSGHDHMYTRSKPIKIGTNTTFATMNTNGDFEAKPNGTVFSLVSATGPKFYNIDAAGSDIKQVFSEKTTDTTTEQQPGIYVNVKVTASKLTVTAMNVNGTLIDTYEVPKKIKN